jgi:hypothetical protein
MDTRRSGTGRRGRRGFVVRVAGTAVLIVGLVVGLSQVMAVAAANHRYGFQSEGSSVEFVDRRGNPVDGASLVDLEGLWPGMPARRSVVTLRNDGADGGRIAISSDLEAPPTNSLDEVLLVTVKSRSSGLVVYRGRISELAFEDSPALQAGSSRSFVVAVTWPQSPADDRYQGEAISFGLTATIGMSA